MIVIQDLPTAADFQAGAAENGKLMPQSDDLRIYDVVSGRLRLKLHFRPRGFGPTAAEWVSLRAGATQDDADYAENGSVEVIAGFAQPDVATSALLPFAIEWQYGRYVLISLTRDKPDLGTQGLGRAAITFRRQAYETRVTFHNAVVDPPVSGLTLEGYRVQAFALTRTPSLRLLTGYFGAYPVYGQAHVLEIHANQFRSGISIAPCEPTYWACPAPIAPQDAVIPAAKAFDKGLLQGWDIDSTKWITPVQICPVRSPATTARLCPATQNRARG